MTFKIPARSDNPDAKKPENRFHFEDLDGKKYSVPKLGFVSQTASAYFEQGRELLGSYASFDDPEALAVYQALDPDQLKAFDADWVAESRVAPGESDGSADS